MARNREKESSLEESSEPLNGGYSEKQQALDIESKSGDLSFQKRGRGSISKDNSTLELYRVVTKQLDSLIESYMLILEKDLHQAQKMLSDIEKMRQQQKDLLDKLFG
jgi:hypothetical protein